MQSLKNKIVLITGASAGIGAACAKAFAEQGAKLILNARREERINELSAALTKEYGTEIKKMILDIRDHSMIKESFNSLPDEWKKVDVLINNAGLAKGTDKIQDASVEEWEEVIDTNIKGLLYITREVLPHMIERESGHIINLGSVAGREVYIGGNIYCATKFAVNAISKAIRADCLDKKIKVSSVDPGMVETEFSIVRFHGDKEKAKKVYEGLQPLTPEDIADAVLYCATRPPHVNINEILLTPLAQASAFYSVRD
ncbi:MAG: SDR family oxidoreductase [Ignavibacteriaceae bacterium]